MNFLWLRTLIIGFVIVRKLRGLSVCWIFYLYSRVYFSLANWVVASEPLRWFIFDDLSNSIYTLMHGSSHEVGELLVYLGMLYFLECALSRDIAMVTLFQLSCFIYYIFPIDAQARQLQEIFVGITLVLILYIFILRRK